jgi:3-oxoacyl-[acyl-carrier protein] reductase
VGQAPVQSKRCFPRTLTQRSRPLRKIPLQQCPNSGRQLDVSGKSKDDDVLRLVNDAQAFVEPVEILINNAGGSGEPEDWTTTRPETWASGYDRNVLAAVRMTARLLPNMRAAKWGRIVNISSMAAMMAPAKRPDYGAAKAAMIAMTASLAKEVAIDGITANAVSPGTIHSDRLTTQSMQ